MMLWFLQLTTRARIRSMEVTPQLQHFMQGWALLKSDNVELDFERPLEIRGRARPFQGVELIEIGDGLGHSLPISKVDDLDRACMVRLFSHRNVKWCLHPLVADAGQDVFSYNCFVTFDYPNTPEDVEFAKQSYFLELSRLSKQLTA